VELDVLDFVAQQLEQLNDEYSYQRIQNLLENEFRNLYALGLFERTDNIDTALATMLVRDLGAHAASVILRGEDEQLVVAAETGLTRKDQDGHDLPLRLRVGEGIAGSVIASARPRHEYQLTACKEYGDQKLVRVNRLGSVLAVPIIVRENSMGAILYYTRDDDLREFRPFACNILQIVSHLCGVAHEISDLQAHLLDLLECGICIIRPNWTVAYGNRRQRETFPHLAACLSTRGEGKCYELYGRPGAQGTTCPWCPVRAALDGHAMSTITHASFGRYNIGHYHTAASPLRDRKGHIRGAMEVVTDETAEIGLLTFATAVLKLDKTHESNVFALFADFVGRLSDSDAVILIQKATPSGTLRVQGVYQPGVPERLSQEWDLLYGFGTNFLASIEAYAQRAPIYNTQAIPGAPLAIPDISDLQDLFLANEALTAIDILPAQVPSLGRLCPAVKPNRGLGIRLQSGGELLGYAVLLTSQSTFQGVRSWREWLTIGAGLTCSLLRLAHEAKTRDTLLSQMRKLAELTRLLTLGVEDEDSIAFEITKTTAELLQAQTASLWLVNEGGSLDLRANHLGKPKQAVQLQVRGGPGAGLTSHVAATGELVNLKGDLHAHVAFRGVGPYPHLDPFGAASVGLAPIKSLREKDARGRPRIIGVIEVENRLGEDARPRPSLGFDEDQVVLLKLLAGTAGVCFDNWHLAKDLEKARDQTNQHLETIVGSITKASFFAWTRLLAHEVKNLLLDLTSEIHELIEEPRRLPDRERRQLKQTLHRVSDTADQVATLIRIASKQDPGPAVVDDINHLVPVAVRLCLPGLQRQRVPITVDTVLCSEALPAEVAVADVVIVLYNLLNNAIKAINEQEPKEGEIIVKTSRDGADIVVEVSDNGCGIAKEIEKVIFRIGFSRFEGGTGYGLYSCRQVAETYGGSLLLGPHSVGKGSTFVVRLPGHWTT
jgi:signal transduction histidine kinase